METKTDLKEQMNTEERPVAISVKNVSKVYKLFSKPVDRVVDALHLAPWKKAPEHHALNDVSFDVYQGETIGIIGTNGSGKSTILKIITGVLHPTQGEVKVNGRISALLELGAGFNREYTGLENIYLNGTMIGFSKEEIDARIAAVKNMLSVRISILKEQHLLMMKFTVQSPLKTAHWTKAFC